MVLEKHVLRPPTERRQRTSTIARVLGRPISSTAASACTALGSLLWLAIITLAAVSGGAASFAVPVVPVGFPLLGSGAVARVSVYISVAARRARPVATSVVVLVAGWFISAAAVVVVPSASAITTTSASVRWSAATAAARVVTVSAVGLISLWWSGVCARRAAAGRTVGHGVGVGWAWVFKGDG